MDDGEGLAPFGIDRTSRMNADEYQRLKGIFQSAIEVTGEERERLLDESCNGDTSMRREVERLLRSHYSDFLETPPVNTFANSISEPSSRSGQRIGHYNVQKKIGSGGMGDVYLAVDGKLGRRVAIKILPEEFTTDEDRLDRFQLEARSASSLSHPNILTIHEIGEWEGTHYIATEYVEGETLRQRIARGRHTVGESLEIGVQLVSAIAAAHEAGICHRDIKPENVMIRRDGIVKVVDFGLAKLSISPFRSDQVRGSHDEPTVKIVRTEPGVIMGTVQYMSPEQTRGLPTDERSDIWSLGCVLYEMLAGQPPFSGESSADLIAEIVKTHPPALPTFDSEVPERLDEIVAKTLEKNPDERYQTAKDLCIDLKRLKRRFEVEDILERSNPSLSNNSDDKITAPNIISTRKGPKDLTEVNSAEYLYWGIKAHRWTTIGIVLFVLSMLGGTAFLVRQYWRKPERTPQAFESVDIARLTTSGKATGPALSVDGRFVAYVNSDVLDRSIFIRQISTGTDIRVAPPTKAVSIYGLRFSIDGDFLYYTVDENLDGSLYRVPSIGGTPKLIAADIDSSVTFSPDGNRFAFVRWTGDISHIMSSNIDGSGIETFFSLPSEGSIQDISWSPDGKRFAFFASKTSDLDSFTLKTISIPDGRIEIVGVKRWPSPRSLSWKNDGLELIFSATENTVSPSRIWSVSYPEGQARMVTTDYGSYDELSQTSAEGDIAMDRVEHRTSIWSLDLDTNRTSQVTSERVDRAGAYGFDETNDGSLLVARSDSAHLNIWRLNGPDFRTETRITEEPTDHYGPVAPVGISLILYIAALEDGIAIWRADEGGQNARPVTKPGLNTDTNPILLNDNRTLLFIRTIDGFAGRVMRTNIDEGGEREVLSLPNTWVRSIAVSPDGSIVSIAVTPLNNDGEAYKGPSIRLLRWNGQELSDADRKVDSSMLGPMVNRSIVSGQGLIIANSMSDVANLYLEQKGTKKFKKITDFKDGMILRFKMSRDKKRVFFVRQFSSSDIFLMKDKRKA
jgi:eukaryotic-like serine/threonine-protein kinase